MVGRTSVENGTDGARSLAFHFNAWAVPLVRNVWQSAIAVW